MIRHWNHVAMAAAAGLALLLAFFSVSCSSTSVNSEGVPSHLPDIQLSGSNETPPHSMASYEYPFDTNGRYVSEWAAEGERRAGRSASATSADTEKWSKSHGGSQTGKKSSTKSKSDVASSKSKGEDSNSKSSTSGKRKSSSSSGESTVASSKGKDGTSAKGKPKTSSSSTDSTVAKSDSATAKSGKGTAKSDSDKVTTTTKAKPRPPSNDSENKRTTASKAKPKASNPDDTVAKSESTDSGKVTTSTKAKGKATGSDSDNAATSKSGDDKAATSTKTGSKAESSSSYTIKAVDTVERIARRCGTTPKKLMAANGMTSDFLKIGRVLKLP